MGAVCGLSRTPIREVLWKLSMDGFLDQETNRGFVVRELSLEQIFDVFRTREAIEGMAARNGMLAEVYEKLQNLTLLTANMTRKSASIEVDLKDAHLAIIDFLLAGDEEASARATKEHLRETCRTIVEGFYPGMMAATAGSRSAASRGAPPHLRNGPRRS